MNNNFNKQALKNKLRLVTIPMKNTRAVTILVLVGTGSKYETKNINGISHFLEHMFFKGTKNKPTTLDIAESLDQVGGQFNAFTGKECTGYWAKLNKKHIDIGIDWVSDVLINSLFDPKEIEREKGVVIEEINMYLDTPRSYISNIWDQLLYKNQPAGRSILGEKEIIGKMKRKEFINYLNNHYTSPNTVVVVAGNIDKNIKEKIEQKFKDLKQTKPKEKQKTKEKQTKPELLINYKKTDQTHLRIGVRAYNLFHKDKYALDVLSTILGGGMSSRLFIDVRERQGLGYYVFSSTQKETDVGNFFTQAGIDNKRVEKAIKIILENYKKLKEEKIEEKELKKAKEHIKGKAILKMEESDEVAAFYGFQELLTKKTLTLEEKFNKIDSVTAEDIQRVAKDIFQPNKLNLCLIGPFKNKEKFKKLLKI
ncbi:MAG: hypothetical protein GF387_02590 [Candidatus Portnoybacteria bacterium]|nr:hypothetical protein [Candidatus Portnoybacteria bacterium]